MKLLHVLQKLLYPAYCVGCGRFGTHICKACLRHIEPLVLQPSFCFANSQITFHALFAYQRPLSNLIKTMKYQEVTAIADTLAHLAYFSLPSWQIEHCTAVPMHASKQSQRGFNQAELIAKALSPALEIPFQPLLKKTISTKPQAGLSQQDRVTHFQTNTFQATQTTLTGSVLLVDDVITTGATLHSCAQTLLAVGAKHVYCLGIAHSAL